VLRVQDGDDVGDEWTGKINATNNLIKKSENKVDKLADGLNKMKDDIDA
jgi:hypothetical protein